MAAVLFDTHTHVKRLRETGLTEVQAETITELQQQASVAAVQQALHDYHLDELASKRDIKEIEAALRRDLEILRAESKKDIAETRLQIAETKAELIRWVVGVGLLQSSLIVGVLLKTAHLM